MCWPMTTIVRVNGTARTRPSGPHSKVQNTALSSTAIGDRLVWEPNRIGSMNCPTIMSPRIKIAAVTNSIHQPGAIIAASAIGIAAERNEPT